MAPRAPEPARLAELRAEAEAAVDRLAKRGRLSPLERIAWLTGVGVPTDRMRPAVEVARDAGFTWSQIAGAMDGNAGTVANRYGAGYERMRAWRERQAERAGE